MSLTASKITADALLMLKAKGCRVRRVNNVGAYKKRSNQVIKGLPDIIGYSHNGVAVWCEVKTQGDKLSKEQKEELQDCHDRGGISLIAHEINGQTTLTKYVDYIK